ncbi:ABC transporter ATP-binding protein [Peptacetobacter sp.]|uniref:ABC transporter ATP-binding protein n=1 Tax=Peptacetobacter sp. TaxID=2991975 RepID=UPI0026104B87|nr:ABC transporter ATP-binding protein [Peptacetobacter sp.]MED9947283.1 ABC transporter ATP-binding protein [Peptacetobacter hiranonis]MEE0451617.1 ABC transporter ATP-binding protein [Peptacetobacter sp.]
MEKKNILSVDDLVVSFSMYKGLFKKENLEVVHSLSLDINEGEIVAVVGSSGSGKSLLAHAVLGLLPKNASTSGKILYEGEELTDKKRSELLGRKIVFIPQSIDYLDPVMKVGKQVQGVYSTKERQEELFEKYKLDKSVEDMYPFQLSGGMARRVLVSSALMEMPRLIVADEPTPGLSVDMAMDTLKHFREIADKGAGVLLITHDIDLALHVADRIAVFYAGTIFEIASTKDFLEGRDALRHPYSKEFISALPQNEFKSIEGLQPYAGELPKGCLYASRCPYVSEKCSGEIPMRELRGGKVRCVNAT